MHYTEILAYLEKASRNPPPKVREALREGRVIILSSGGRKAHIFKSRSRDYLVIPGRVCTCRDFEINVVFKKLRPACYHLVTTHIALKEGLAKTLNVPSDVYDDIITEVIYAGKSSTLRKILHELRSSAK